MNKKKLLVLLPTALMAAIGTSCSIEANTSSTSSQTTSSQASDSGSSSEIKQKGKVTIATVEHGSVAANKMEAEVGETITFTITIDEDWHLVDLKVNAVAVTVTNLTASATMVEGGLNVVLTLAQDTHTVTIRATTNGTVTANKETAIIGADVTFTITPAANYELDTFKINGEAKTVTNNTITVQMVKAGLDVEATFKAIKYAVTIADGIENGAVTADKTTAAVGEDVVLTIVPNENYHLSELKVNDEAVSVTNNTATVKMVANGLTITATFAINQYTVTITQAEHGSVSADKTDCSAGETVTFTITPDADYEIDTLLINGTDHASEITNNTLSVTIASEGLTVVPAFKAIQHAVTIPTDIENGTVTANKDTAITGENVTFTVTPATGYNVDTFKVNGTEVEVTDGTVTVPMTSNGLTIEATFTDYYKTVDITDSLKAEIEAAENFKLRLTGDCEASTIPLAKKSTIVDLGGHTLTINGKMAVSANKNDAGDALQEITVKNGNIVYATVSEELANIFEVTDAKAFTLDGVTVTQTGSVATSSTGICFSNATEVTVKNSTLNLNMTFGIGTNNLQGANAKIVIDNSKITVTTEDKDNAAFVGNVEGLNAEIINGSVLKADRQAVLARTGTWKVEDSEFIVTGDWLKTESNRTINNNRLSGNWGSGNEVDSGAIIVGDESSAKYNDSVTMTMDNLKVSSSNGAKSVSIHSDGVYTTRVTMDAITALNCYAGFNVDSDDTTSVTKNNFKEVTIAELRALTSDDSKNIYAVRGVILDIYNAKYGNMHVADPKTGEEIISYGTFLDNTYSFDSSTSGFVSSESGTRVDSSYIGREVVLAGVFKKFGSEAEIVNSTILTSSSEKIESKIKKEVEGSGTIAFDRESYSVGDKVTITSTPTGEGTILKSLMLTRADGTQTDISTSLSFNAGINDTVKAVFGTRGAITKMTLTTATLSFLGKYPSGESTGDMNIDGETVSFKYAQIGNYSNGIQLRTSDNTNAYIYNTTELPGEIESVEVTPNQKWTSGNNSLAITFGTSEITTAGTSNKVTAASHEKVNCDVAGARYIRFDYIGKNAMYIDSIVITFKSAA